MIRKMFLACAIAAATLVGPALSRAEEAMPTAPAAAKINKGKGVYQRILKSTALILVRTADGGQTGTGWVADREQRLVVTNHHVVKGGKEIAVVFPQFRNGKVLTDPKEYANDSSVIKAALVESDPTKDLAVLKLESLPEGTPALALAAEGPDTGDAIHAIGNPGVAGGLWVYSQGTVRGSARLRDNGNDVNTIVSDLKLNPGDSGGPAVDEDGRVVGVNVAINKAGQGLSYSIDVGEVQLVLNQVKKGTGTPRTAQDYVKRGNKFLAERDFEKAKADYAKAIALDDDCLEAYTQRAWIHNDQGNFDEAIDDCTEALKIDARSKDALRERGFAYIKTKRYSKAIVDLGSAAILNPTDVTILRYLGLAFEGTRDWKRAFDSYMLAFLSAKDGSTEEKLLEKKLDELKKKIDGDE